MKDSELIALLNLYIDNEIGAEDAARLEAEVTRNVGSRRIYRQYCRMHKACVLLADRSGQEAPGEDKLVAFEAPRRGWSAGMAAAAGLMAAAACAALIVAGHRPAPAAVSAPASAIAQDAPVRGSAPDASAVVPQSGTKADLQPVFTVRSLASSMDNSASADLLPSGERDSAFAWMSSVQMAPIQRLNVNPMVFGPTPVFSGADAHAINSDPSYQQPPAERVSFQFQK